MSEINALKKRRAYIKGSMTKLINFTNSIDHATNVEDIRVRLVHVERYRTEFNNIEDKIVAINDDEELDTDFEDNYYRAVAGLNRALRGKTEPTVSLNDTILETSALGLHMDVKLPKLSIPFFAGEYTEWQSFHDLFCSTIHDSPKLTPSQKLQYLKGTLKGEAANLLKHFSITDANYIEAWRKLRERYDKQKHTIYAFIKNFMSQPSLTTANTTNVRQLLDTSDEILRGLKALGDEAESRDHWLICILVNKLDHETNNLWAQASAEYKIPTIKQFFEFLARRVDALDSLKCSSRRSQQQINPTKPTVRSHFISKFSTTALCALCPQEYHRLIECKKFNDMPIEERRCWMKSQNRCFNCFNKNHNVTTCRSKYRCRTCNKAHHTLLHSDNISQQVSTTASANIESCDDNPPNASYQVSIFTTNQTGNTLLPTALVKVADQNSQYQICRILLDSGSQGSFITEKCVQKLQLKRKCAKLAISGIGATKSGYTRGAVSLTITPRNKTSPKLQVEAFVLPKLTTKPSSISESINLDEIRQYELADPKFYNDAEIDIIIGADVFFQMLSDGKIITTNRLILQNTLLGWVIAGKTNQSPVSQSITINSNNSKIDLDKLLRKFWEIEQTESARPQLSPEEQRCVEYFNETTTRDSTGRFTVRLPFKNSPSILGNSYVTAVQRMHSIERKFARNQGFAALYKTFMLEYLALGHMKKVDDTRNSNQQNTYYLPHHGVIKNMSTTTKLRVVFDGSAKTSTGKSLNDCLAVGPTMQSTLYAILFRFRKSKVALTADIEKMYRQIRIAESDTPLQRIIWRDDTSKPFNTYELQTVTYGTASASYLATRALIEAANLYVNEFPNAAHSIINQMYVDDLMSGAETLDAATKLKDEINFILSRSGFTLRKWLSNESVLSDNTELKSKTLDIEDSTNNYTKVLGLNWDPTKDIFHFKVTLNEQPTTTKRGILSEASRLFDPLGWLAPITITIKIFFQTLWAENLGWDDQLSPELLNEWLKLRENLIKIENIEIDRYLNTNSSSKMKLYGFSDASKQAYSAVVYGNITNSNGESTIKLLSAKTKVAPVKQLSIPRLELCGAVLLSKLLINVKQALKMEITEIVAWTDSTIVLDWLSAHPSKWNTFVGNRTGEILTNFSRSQWRHVESQENPADCASRGMEVEQFKHFHLWWSGPKWLTTNENWPESTNDKTNALEELHIHSLNAQVSQPNIIDELILRISSFNTIVRVLAYVLRYTDIKLKRINKTTLSPHLTTSEIQRSKRIIFRHRQQQHFNTEIQLIISNNELPASSKLKYFQPFIDESGLLRVGGRITNASITYEIKHPIILAAQDKLSEIIVREHHIHYLHAGPTLMMATLRYKYWILGGRNLIRKVIHKCVKCVKYKAQTLNQVMGQLPNSRVELVRPFYKVGVDYAGPFQTYFTRGRGQKPHKSYVCIFVCLATKAAHIELVSDLTTDSYTAALKRFVARRGICKEIYSDNGTNFVGTRNHLHQFFTLLKQNTNLISNFLLADEITFKFIPPGAPHFGGLWEAAVKSIKYHLRRVTDGHTLTLEEMYTLLTEIEAMLNSRPICSLSANELDYLTPSHFLIGRPSTQLPQDDVLDTKISKLSRWQWIQRMNQHIWRRWHIEYLTILQHTNKWHKRQSNITIDNIVLIKDVNLSPCKWLMGKIIQLHPGTDGNVRVVTVKTTNGTIKRPIHKLCLLPVD